MARSLSILIVDDQPEVTEVLSNIAIKAGHSAICCRSGVEAWQKLQIAAHSFSLIITDHFMPGSFDGLGLVRVARAKGFKGQIVVTSGRLSQEVKESYRDHAVLGFVPKPFDFKLLQAFIHGATLVPSPFRESLAAARPAVKIAVGTSSNAS